MVSFLISRTGYKSVNDGGAAKAGGCFPAVQVIIHFEIDCAIFYRNFHELICQFIC